MGLTALLPEIFGCGRALELGITCDCKLLMATSIKRGSRRPSGFKARPPVVFVKKSLQAAMAILSPEQGEHTRRPFVLQGDRVSG